MKKIKDFFIKNKQTILKSILILVVIAVIALASYFILKHFGFTERAKFEELRNRLGDSIWFWSIIVGLQVIQVVFIPISNSLISAPVALIFNNELWKVFLSSWIGISIGTVILYFIGKYAGGKLLNFVLGDKEKVEKLKQFMLKGKAFFVIGDLIPVLPNDVLTTISGMSGYSFTFVFVVTLITRAICIATTVWIFGYITVYPWLIAVLAALLIFMVFAGIFVTKRSIDNNKK